MSEPTRKVYVVVQSEWTYNDEFYTGEDAPLKAFTDREQAEAYLARCELRLRTHPEYQRWSEPDQRFTLVELEVGGTCPSPT